MITDIKHPTYVSQSFLWEKWRHVFEGGDDFIEKYLEKHSKLEDPIDFTARKKITPIPAFAKAAVNDVKNSIFQRMSDIVRKDGTKSYMQAITGKNNGVDLQGATMDAFMGRDVLPELLTMARVGVFVDMPAEVSITRADDRNKRPYLYLYRAEDILSWVRRKDDVDEFQSVLLRDRVEDCDTETGLPKELWERYRLIFRGPDGEIRVRFLERYLDSDQNVKERQVDINREHTTEDVILEIPEIPFVMLGLTDSLLSDVSNHQIALLNMESADISYALKSNFPFYTEQQDMRLGTHINGPSHPGNDGSSDQANTSKDKAIKGGPSQGRAYAKDLDRPGFIHPSSEPLQISMEKQQSLKDDIKTLINLSLSNVKASSKMASAESKQMDERGLESGLSYIGMELEVAERKIAKYWADYESADIQPTIKYPEKYALMSDEDRRKKADQLNELSTSAPSKKFTKEVQKQIAHTLLLGKVSQEDFDSILAEIDKAEVYSLNPEVIFESIERGLLSNKTGASFLGYNEDEPQKAAKDHAERLARIAESQSANREDAGARGVPDLDPDPGTSGEREKAESRDTTQDATVTDKVRGEGNALRDSE